MDHCSHLCPGLERECSTEILHAPVFPSPLPEAIPGGLSGAEGDTNSPLLRNVHLLASDGTRKIHSEFLGLSALFAVLISSKSLSLLVGRAMLKKSLACTHVNMAADAAKEGASFLEGSWQCSPASCWAGWFLG